MRTAIEVIWWIGLLGALVPTLVILKEVSLLLRVLTDIHRLGIYTRDAARGIAINVDVAPQLIAASENAARVCGSMVAVAREVEERI